MKGWLCLWLLSGMAGAQELALDYRRVVQMAVAENLQLRSVDLQSQQAEARWEVAQAQRNPTLTVNGFYVHNDLNLVRSLEPDRKYIPLAEAQGLDASDLYVTAQNQMLNRSVLAIPIYTGGRLESQMHRQQHLFEASQSELQRSRQATILGAKRQYLRWLLSDRSLEVAQRSREKAAQLKSDTQSRYNAGTAQGYDLMQGELAVAQAEERYKAAEAAREQERLQLARFLNQPQDQPMRFLDRLGSSRLLEDEPSQSDDPQELAQIALQNRPELEALRRIARSVVDEEGIAEAGRRPQLLVNLNYDLIGNTLKLRGGFALISSLLIPLYDGGVADAKLGELRTRTLQLKREELAQAEEVVEQVMQARWARQEAESRWLVAQTGLRRSQEALRIAQKRYEVGAGTTLELVTQTTQLEVADYAMAQADFARLEARAALRWALGES